MKNVRLKILLFLATVVFIGTGTSVLADKRILDESQNGFHVKQSTSKIELNHFIHSNGKTDFVVFVIKDDVAEQLYFIGVNTLKNEIEERHSAGSIMRKVSIDQLLSGVYCRQTLDEETKEVKFYICDKQVDIP